MALNHTMHTLLPLLFVTLAVAAEPENAPFKDLREKGITTADGSTFRLPSPTLADGLDAAAQRAALEKIADAKNTLDKLLENSYYSPVLTKVGTLRAAKDPKSSAVRSIDIWFVAHGDWKTLQSKEFADSAVGKENTKSNIVLKAGELTADELKKRKLTAEKKEGREERFLYTTFVLFDCVEVSATRFSVLTHSGESILAAGRVDARFDRDAEHPNAWRELLRDAEANVTRGPSHVFANAGGYAKVTRLKEPAGAVLIECHIIYEEPYVWFDGMNLVKQKLPVIVQEKAKIFRRKWATASEDNKEHAGKKEVNDNKPTETGK
jgi:hypothetical protein